MPKRTRRVRRARHVTRKRGTRKGGTRQGAPSVNNLANMFGQMKLGTNLPNRNITNDPNVNMGNGKYPQRVEEPASLNKGWVNREEEGWNSPSPYKPIMSNREQRVKNYYNKSEPVRLFNRKNGNTSKNKNSGIEPPTMFPESEELRLSHIKYKKVYDWLKGYWEKESRRVNSRRPASPSYETFIGETVGVNPSRRLSLKQENYMNQDEREAFYNAIRDLRDHLYFS